MSDIVNYLDSHPGLFTALAGIATLLGVVVGWIIAYFRWKKARTPAPVSSSASAAGAGLPAIERSRKRFWLILAGSSAVLLSAAIVYFWPTPNGVIRIEINDPEIVCVFNPLGATFKGKDKQEIRVVPDQENGLHIKRGDLEFDTDKFILKNGETITLKIEWFKEGKLQVVQGDKVIAEKIHARLELAKTRPSADKNDAAKLPTDSKLLEVDLGGGVKMKLAFIKPGKFTMGSPKSEQDYVRKEFGEGPDDHLALEVQHEVEITKPFYMGAFTVTQQEYEQVTGNNPSFFCAAGGGKERVASLDTARFPVENVSWYDAMEFCKKLSQRTGKEFDLPTEAEWEYACRGGTKGPFHFGESLSSKQANFDGNVPYGAAKAVFLQRTAKVGSYEANAFGLFDMHGNVWQWCKDWYQKDYYNESPASDPQGPANGKSRVLRGGSWNLHAGVCRSAYRNHNAPGLLIDRNGFRVILRSPLVGLSVLDARVGTKIKWDWRLWESMYPLKVTAVSLSSERAPKTGGNFRAALYAPYHDLILTCEYTMDDVDKKVERAFQSGGVGSEKEIIYFFDDENVVLAKAIFEFAGEKTGKKGDAFRVQASIQSAVIAQAKRAELRKLLDPWDGVLRHPNVDGVLAPGLRGYSRAAEQENEKLEPSILKAKLSFAFLEEKFPLKVTSMACYKRQAGGKTFSLFKLTCQYTEDDVPNSRYHSKVNPGGGAHPGLCSGAFGGSHLYFFDGSNLLLARVPLTNNSDVAASGSLFTEGYLTGKKGDAFRLVVTVNDPDVVSRVRRMEVRKN